MIWEDLIKTALIGTDRTKLSDDTLQSLKALGIDTQAHPAKIIMDAISIYAPIQKVGRPLPKWSDALPAACPPESQVCCSEHSIQHLAMILNSNYHGEILNEFLQHMQRQQMVLPAEQLPSLLQRCQNNPPLWSLLKEVIGQRGYWLIQQNSDWQQLNYRVSQADWETGTRAKRLLYLKQHRQVTPHQTIALLTAQWAKEDFRTRLSFLQCLSVNLSTNDEAFLEENLQDRKKEIRQAAAVLLAQIPSSAFNARILDKVKTIIHHQKKLLQKDQFALSLPSLEDPFFKENGIPLRQGKYPGGPKAALVGQLIALIPPASWKDFFATKDIPAILRLFARSEWSALFFNACIDACILHQAEDWMRAILFFIGKEKERTLRQTISFDKLFRVLPDTVFNEVALALFEQQQLLTDETDLLTKLLQNKVRPWEDQLSLRFLESLKTWIVRSDNAWGGWHYKQVLAVAQYAVAPERYKSFTQDWPEQARNWHNWVEPVERFLSIVSFRKKMALAFEKNNNDEK